MMKCNYITAIKVNLYRLYVNDRLDINSEINELKSKLINEKYLNTLNIEELTIMSQLTQIMEKMNQHIKETEIRIENSYALDMHSLERERDDLEWDKEDLEEGNEELKRIISRLKGD